MPRVCTACAHPERDAIDAALVRGEESKRRIAARFSVSETAIRRHVEHVPSRLSRAAERQEIASIDSLLERLRSLNAEVASILREAKAKGQLDIALKAIARAEKQIELEGRLLGELQEGTTINVAIMPEWLALRSALLGALGPYPEARAAVLHALEYSHE